MITETGYQYFVLDKIHVDTGSAAARYYSGTLAMCSGTPVHLGTSGTKLLIIAYCNGKPNLILFDLDSSTFTASYEANYDYFLTAQSPFAES